MKKPILLFFIFMIPIFGNSNRYQIGEGRFQVGMNFGISSYTFQEMPEQIKLSILGNQKEVIRNSSNITFEIGANLGRFANSSGGLILSYGITDRVNISISSPIFSLFSYEGGGESYNDQIIGGSSMLSLDYTIDLTENLFLIINPTISKVIYHTIIEDSGDNESLNEITPTLDYGINFLLLFQQNNLFAELIIGYHKNNKKDGDYYYDEWMEEFENYSVYPELSQSTVALNIGFIIDELSSIKAGFLNHKIKISFNENRSESTSFIKLNGVYSRKISDSSFIDIALSSTDWNDWDNASIFGLDFQLTMNF